MPACPLTVISNNAEAKCPSLGGFRARFWVANLKDWGVPTYDDGVGNNNLITALSVPAGSLYRIECVEAKNTSNTSVVDIGGTRLFKQSFTASFYYKDAATSDKIRALIQADNLVIIAEKVVDTADKADSGVPRFQIFGNSAGLSTRDSPDANTKNYGLVQTDDTGFTLVFGGVNSHPENYFRTAPDSTYDQDLTYLEALEA